MELKIENKDRKQRKNMERTWKEIDKNGKNEKIDKRKKEGPMKYTPETVQKKLIFT